jgi:hypothetical protein
MNMQHTQHESVFSAVRKIFVDEKPAKQGSTEMRPLTNNELRAVAGGPEVEINDGNGGG